MGKLTNQLGVKTKSDNVILPVDLGHFYSYGEFINNTVPSFKVLHPRGIIAFRLPYEYEWEMGNPFNWKKYGKNEATAMFGNWLITGKDYLEPQATQSLRYLYLSIITDPESKGQPILYYKELGYPSHATVIDFLINKYEGEFK